MTPTLFKILVFGTFELRVRVDDLEIVIARNTDEGEIEELMGAIDFLLADQNAAAVAAIGIASVMQIGDMAAEIADATGEAPGPTYMTKNHMRAIASNIGDATNLVDVIVARAKRRAAKKEPQQ